MTDDLSNCNYFKAGWDFRDGHRREYTMGNVAKHSFSARGGFYRRRERANSANSQLVKLIEGQH